ncbi:MAG: hypothetical protein NVSMB17_07650 [Candidatus Dormibacteria bacterium]
MNDADGLLRAAAQSLRDSGSYRVTGMIDPGIVLDLVVVKSGSKGHVTTHGLTYEEVASHGRLWIRGAALWKATLSAEQAATFDDDWVQVRDPAAAFNFAGLLVDLERRIPGTVFGPHRGLKAAQATYAGREVIELRNGKDLYDLDTGRVPYPLRWVDTENPGPDGQPCGITLGEYNAAATVSPPASHLALDPRPSPSPS